MPRSEGRNETPQQTGASGLTLLTAKHALCPHQVEQGRSLQSNIWEGDVRALALVVGLLLLCGTARSATDVFMRAVGFALTGSDDAEPQAIDRANCIFAYKSDVFHLNN